MYLFRGEAPVYMCLVMEADNDTLCSSGSRRSDATVSVCCKRMSVGETCVKRGDISCC